MFKKILFFLPVLVVVIAAIYILRFNPWKVESESVSLQNASCVSEQQIITDVPLRGQNLLLINEKQIASKIKNKYICVKSVEVKRLFPSKIVISVLGRTPSIVLVPKSLDATTSAQIANFLSDITPNEATPSSQSALIEDLIKSPSLNYSGMSFLVDIEGVVYSNMRLS